MKKIKNIQTKLRYFSRMFQVQAWIDFFTSKNIEIFVLHLYGDCSEIYLKSKKI